MKKTIIPTLLILIGFTSFINCNNLDYKVDKSIIISYEINPKKQNLKFKWKNENGEIYRNFENLKQELGTKNKELVFAMNGGMYKKDLTPQGLYIENGIEKIKIDTTQDGYGNFYLQPNGILLITNENTPKIIPTEKLEKVDSIKYATQSGPLLLIDGQIHPKLTKGSKNLHIRNGVGILPDGNLLFAMSKQKINFFDFATYFKQNKCKDALYLDGFVSRTYLPSKDWKQTDGNFGVIICETKIKKQLE